MLVTDMQGAKEKSSASCLAALEPTGGDASPPAVFFLLLLLLAGFGLLELLRSICPRPASRCGHPRRSTIRGAHAASRSARRAPDRTSWRRPRWRRRGICPGAPAGRAATAWQRYAEARSSLAVVRGRRQERRRAGAELEPAMLRQVQAEPRPAVGRERTGDRRRARPPIALLAGRYGPPAARPRQHRRDDGDGFSGSSTRRGGRTTPGSANANLALWRSWVEETVAQSRRDQEHAIIVDKLKRKLYVYAGSRIATLDAEPAPELRQKMHSGDQARRGRYRVVQLKSGRRTICYKALLINYERRRPRPPRLRQEDRSGAAALTRQPDRDPRRRR